MTTVHFLTKGFVAPNVRAFLFPLIIYRQALRDQGIVWRAFGDPAPGLFDCDVLVVESNVHGKRWTVDTAGILRELETYGAIVDRLFYLDASDSSALLQPEVLPLVERYFKGQLLAERWRYGEAQYGRRLFTDFVHRNFGVEDDQPERATPVTRANQLAKLGVWWNSSLADWSPAGRYRMGLYARLPFAPFLAFPRRYTDPRAPRAIDVSCRMGVEYARETVAWHRKTARRELARWAPADRVSHRAYVQELRSSKVVVSPFGWGEINYRDYETFLAGAALTKPDMSHLETWPDLYAANETYAAYSWDAEDLVPVIEEALQRLGQRHDPRGPRGVKHVQVELDP